MTEKYKEQNYCSILQITANSVNETAYIMPKQNFPI